MPTVIGVLEWDASGELGLTIRRTQRHGTRIGMAGGNASPITDTSGLGGALAFTPYFTRNPFREDMMLTRISGSHRVFP
jgi:hypothetical protein